MNKKETIKFFTGLLALSIATLLIVTACGSSSSGNGNGSGSDDGDASKPADKDPLSIPGVLKSEDQEYIAALDAFIHDGTGGSLSKEEFSSFHALHKDSYYFAAFTGINTKGEVKVTVMVQPDGWSAEASALIPWDGPESWSAEDKTAIFSSWEENENSNALVVEQDIVDKYIVEDKYFYVSRPFTIQYDYNAEPLVGGAAVGTTSIRDLAEILLEKSPLEYPQSKYARIIKLYFADTNDGHHKEGVYLIKPNPNPEDKLIDLVDYSYATFFYQLHRDFEAFDTWIDNSGGSSPDVGDENC